MNIKSIFLIVCFLTGCATTATECDPTKVDASLFTKLSCDTSGGYSKNITANEQQLQRNQEINRLAHQILFDIEARKQKSDQTLSQEKSDLLSLKNSVGLLVSKLRANGGNQSRLKRQLDELSVAEQSFNPSASDTDAQIKAKQKEAAVLEAKVKQLSESLGY